MFVTKYAENGLSQISTSRAGPGFGDLQPLEREKLD